MCNTKSTSKSTRGKTEKYVRLWKKLINIKHCCLLLNANPLLKMDCILFEALQFKLGEIKA